MLALLYCTRCQFWDWFFDGRIRIKKDRVAHFFESAHTLSSVLSRVLDTWSSWSPEVQVLYSNALWIHNRALSYEWDWERFLMRYMALDAAWAVARKILGLSEVHQRKRIAILCDRFGLAEHLAEVAEFVRLRNTLFHEALWDKGRPCSAGSIPAAMAEIYLGHFNERLLLAIGGVRGGFVSSDWLSIDYFSFDVE